MITEEKIRFTAEDNTGVVFDGLTKRVKDLEEKLKGVNIATIGAAKSAGVFSSAFMFLKTGLVVGGIYKILQTVKDLGVSFVSTADQVNALQNKLRSVTADHAQAKTIFGDLLSTSVKYGVSLETNVKMMQRMALVQQSLGASKKDLVELAETVNKIGIIGGSSSSEMSYGLIQFVQMLSYSKTQAQELNSLIENIPMLADLIAKNFKKASGEIGLSTGELKKLIETGIVTNKDIYEAVKRGGEGVEAQMKGMVPTFDLAMESLKAGLTAVIERFESATNVAEGFNTWLKEIGKFAGSFSLTDSERENAAIERRREILEEMNEVAKEQRDLISGNGGLFTGGGRFDQVGALKDADEKLAALAARYSELTKEINAYGEARSNINEVPITDPNALNEEDRKKLGEFYEKSRSQLEKLAMEYNEMAKLSQKTFESEKDRLKLHEAMKRKLEEIKKLDDKEDKKIKKDEQRKHEEILSLLNASLTSEEKLEGKLARINQLLKQQWLTREQIEILQNAKAGVEEKIAEKHEEQKKHLEGIRQKLSDITDTGMARYIEAVNTVNEALRLGIQLSDEQVRTYIEMANQKRLEADPEYSKLKSGAESRIERLKTPKQKLNDELYSISQEQDAGMYGQGIDAEATAMQARQQALDDYLVATNSATIQLRDMWRSLGDSIASSMGDAVVDIMLKQQTAGEALQQIMRMVFRSIVSGLVEIGVKMALNAAFGQSMQKVAVASAVAGNAAIASSAAVAAAYEAAATWGANVAAGGAAMGAFTAGIPAMMGTAAAMAMSGGAIGVAHDGLSSVPTTGTYLLERGEKVVSNQDTAKLDRLLERGSQASGDNISVNVNVNAIDAQTGVAFLMKNKNIFVGAVQEAYSRRGQRGPMG